MTEILAGMLGGFVWGTVLLFSTGIFKKHIVPLFIRKEPDEIEMLERTIWSKREELYRRNQIERLSSEIERLDEHLYPEEKEQRRESLNEVYAGVTNRYNEKLVKSPKRPTRNVRGTHRKPVKDPEPPMSKRGGTYEHSGPTKEEEEFYFGDASIDVRPDGPRPPSLIKEPGPTYPEKVVAYADGVIIQKESKYPPLKTIGGNADE